MAKEYSWTFDEIAAMSLYQVRMAVSEMSDLGGKGQLKPGELESFKAGRASAKERILSQFRTMFGRGK